MYIYCPNLTRDDSYKYKISLLCRAILDLMVLKDTTDHQAWLDSQAFEDYLDQLERKVNAEHWEMLDLKDHLERWESVVY